MQAFGPSRVWVIILITEHGTHGRHRLAWNFTLYTYKTHLHGRTFWKVLGNKISRGDYREEHLCIA